KAPIAAARRCSVASRAVTYGRDERPIARLRLVDSAIPLLLGRTERVAAVIQPRTRLRKQLLRNGATTQIIGTLCSREANRCFNSILRSSKAFIAPASKSLSKPMERLFHHRAFNGS